MAQDTTDPPWLVRAARLLATLPYVAGTETDTPDYWTLPPVEGYEAGYAAGLAMGEACLDYLRRSTGESPVPPDGHVHLRLVIERLIERLRAAESADPANEAAATLRGHLAGFCSRIEARCRESGGVG